LWPPVSGVPHAKVAYVPYLPAQKEGRVIVMLTEVQGCRGSRAEGATARTGGENSAWWSRAGRCGDLWLLVTSIRRVVKL